MSKILLFCLLVSLNAFSQEIEKYNNSGIFFDINLAYGAPIGILTERFGNHLSFGTGLSYQPSSGLDFGVKYQQIFSNDVKEDVLEPYRTDFGQLIGEDFLLTNVALRQRGFFTYLYVGGLFPFGSQIKLRHGLRWKIGPGFMQHRIRIQDDARAAVQLYSDFGRGLDRLTTGLCGVGFLGYELKSKNGKINFYTGLESAIGLTKSRREWNYDLANSDFGKTRNDNYIQFKFGWYLPFFFKKADTIEY